MVEQPLGYYEHQFDKLWCVWLESIKLTTQFSSWLWCFVHNELFDLHFTIFHKQMCNSLSLKFCQPAMRIGRCARSSRVPTSWKYLVANSPMYTRVKRQVCSLLGKLASQWAGLFLFPRILSLNSWHSSQCYLRTFIPSLKDDSSNYAFYKFEIKFISNGIEHLGNQLEVYQFTIKQDCLFGQSSMFLVSF